MDHGKRWFWGMCAAAFVALITLCVFKQRMFDAFQYTSDMFAYNRAIANTLGGRFMHDMSVPYVFSNHSYIILIAFVPLYALVATPLWLIHSAVMAHCASAVLVGLLGRRIGGGPVFGAVLFALYLLNPFLLELTVMPVYGFQPDALAPPFFFGMLLASLSGRLWPAIGCAAALAAVKEEFALLGLGVASWRALLVLARPVVTQWGKIGDVLAPPALCPPGRRHAFFLVVATALFVVVSFAVLTHAKAVTTFSFAPSVGSIGLGDLLEAQRLGRSVTGALRYAAPLGYVLPVLAPEFSLILTPVRIAANEITYPVGLDALKVAAAFSWSVTSCMLLLFLAVLVATARIRVAISNRWATMPPLLLALPFCIGLLLQPGPYPSGAHDAWTYFNGGQWKAERPARTALWRDLDAALAAITLQQPRPRIVVSPKVIASVSAYDAVTPGYIKFLRPDTINEVDLALLLKDDAQGLDLVAGNAAFAKCLENASVAVFARDCASRDTDATPTP